VNANQVFAWRRLYRQGLLESANRLLPVRVVDTPIAGPAARSTSESRTPSGMIQLELPKGHLRIAGRVDAEALRVLLEKLLG
jgi:transposase